MIFVTGAPRSGTSLTAGLLHAAGAWVGEHPGPGPSNPRGFFENTAIRQTVLKPMLESVGGDRLGVRRLPDRMPDADGLRGRVEGIVANQGGREPWLYKDAKLALVWRTWAEAFPEARWVVVRRNADDIVASCRRTHFMAQHGLTRRAWRALIERYAAHLDELARDGPGAEIFRPETVVRGDDTMLYDLVRRLGLRWDEERSRRFVVEEAWRGAAA